MALTAQQAYILSKKYTEETVEGAGAIKGKNCVIDSITDIAETPTKPAGQRVTFKWTLDSGVEQTDTMDVYNGNDGKGISSIYINANDHFIVVYDDGTEEDCGEVVVYSSVDSVNGKTGVVELELPDVVTVGDNLTYNSETNTLSANAQQITVDSAMSLQSENPVQNKVLTHLFDRTTLDIQAKQPKTLDTPLVIGSQSVTKVEQALSALNNSISSEISARQTVDQQMQLAISTLITGVDAAQTKTLVTPLVIDGSTATTVEGALGALNNKTVDVDDALSNVSENPVQNKVVKGALDGKQVDVGLSIVNGKICVTYDVEVTENGQTVTQTVVRPILLDTTGANIVTSLNAIATALQGGDISATSSLPTASIDYVDSIKLLIGTQSGYETGGIYQCTESGGIYSWTLLNGSGGGGGTGGHTIEDGSGTDMTARTNLQFVGASVTDDSSNNRTVVSVAGKADKVQSATENNLAKLDSNGNLADSGIATANVITKSNTTGLVKNDGTIDTDTFVKTSSTAGLLKNDGTVDTTTYVSDISGKADKVTSATNGHLAGLDANGNLTDSGVVGANVVTDISGKANLFIFAPPFSTSTSYSRGEYVTYNNSLYCFTTYKSAGAWDIMCVEYCDEKAMGRHTTIGKRPTTTLGVSATIEGSNNEASGFCSYAEGYGNTASGDYTHCEGYGDPTTSPVRGIASGSYAHCEGFKCIASGSKSHCEGDYCTASADCSHAGGFYSVASGAYSFAHGGHAEATKSKSAAFGSYVTASGECQFVIGEYNDPDVVSGNAKGDHVFMIGNGSYNSPSNAVAVKWNGETTIKGDVIIGQHYDSTQSADVNSNLTVSGIVTVNGSDYAEKFEELEDCPVGRFVTLDGEKIRLAQPDDDYILGVTSEAPAIVGDMSNDGKPVGLIGKLWVEHDGTAKVNGFVKCGKNGIAKEAIDYYKKPKYRVMAVDGNRCKILVK